MKTQFLTLIALVGLVVSTSNMASANTTLTEDKNAIVLTEATNFNKVEIRGNVEVFISDGAADEVKVYNKYYSESAMVQNRNGVLRIASYKNEKLVVWITVSNLRSLTAYDNAEIKSFGQLSAIDIDINLYNNASAQLNVNMFAANININDRAKADLKGNVQECQLTQERSSFVNSSALAVGKMLINNIAYTAPKTLELAGI